MFICKIHKRWRMQVVGMVAIANCSLKVGGKVWRDSSRLICSRLEILTEFYLNRQDWPTIIRI